MTVVLGGKKGRTNLLLGGCLRWFGCKVWVIPVSFTPQKQAHVWRQSAAVLLLEDGLLPLLVSVRSRVTQHGGTRHNSDQIVPTLLVHPRGGGPVLSAVHAVISMFQIFVKRKKVLNLESGRRCRRDSSAGRIPRLTSVRGAAEMSVTQQQWAAVLRRINYSALYDCDPESLSVSHWRGVFRKCAQFVWA